LLKIVVLLTRRQIIVPFGFAIGAFFGVSAIHGIDWTDVRTQITDSSPLAVVVALALVVVSAGLRAIRWRLLFIGHPVRTIRLFMVENAALGLNNVSPLRLLDEPAILTMLSLRDRIPGPLVFATLMMSRIQDLGVTLLFAAVAMAVEPTLAARAAPPLVVGVVFVVILTTVLNFGRLARRFAWIRRMPGVERYGEAVAMLVARKRRLTATVSLTGAYWLILGPMAYMLAQGMGVELSMLQASILVLGAIFFATATPGLPGALGTFELAVVELSGIWDVPQALAVGYGLVLHLAVFLPPVVIALFVLPREGLSFLGKQGAMTLNAVRETLNGESSPTH
jgi:uncharacterized protein (TIRG00374 family)